jgi:hypothetical protein
VSYECSDISQNVYVLRKIFVTVSYGKEKRTISTDMDMDLSLAVLQLHIPINNFASAVLFTVEEVSPKLGASPIVIDD